MEKGIVVTVSVGVTGTLVVLFGLLLWCWYKNYPGSQCHNSDHEPAPLSPLVDTSPTDSLSFPTEGSRTGRQERDSGVARNGPDSTNRDDPSKASWNKFDSLAKTQGMTNIPGRIESNIDGKKEDNIIRMKIKEWEAMTVERESPRCRRDTSKIRSKAPGIISLINNEDVTEVTPEDAGSTVIKKTHGTEGAVPSGHLGMGSCIITILNFFQSIGPLGRCFL